MFPPCAPTFSCIQFWARRELFILKERGTISFHETINPQKDRSRQKSYLQWGAEQTDYLPIYEANRGYFKHANPTLKMVLAPLTFDTVLKGFRSFNAKNLGSVGQRAAKLPAIKLWEWFYPARTKIRADWFECGRGCVADFFLRPPTLTASNFEAL